MLRNGRLQDGLQRWRQNTFRIDDSMKERI